MSESRRMPFDNAAKLDSEQRRRQQPAGPIVDRVVAAAPAVVLDLGVGVGFHALPIAARLPGARVIGLDEEPRMLALLAERAAEAGRRADGPLTPIEPLQASVDAIPLDDGEVDVALMVNLLHELPDRAACLVEVRRVLRDGGLLLVCDVDPDSSIAAHHHHRDHFLAPARALDELRAAGFEPVERLPLYEAHYTLAATAR